MDLHLHRVHFLVIIIFITPKGTTTITNAVYNQYKNSAVAVADKPRDAFRGQSRSPNMVPFHMLGMVSYIECYSNIVPKMRRFSDIRLQK